MRISSMKSAGLLLALAGSAAAAPTLAERQANLLVTLPYGTFRGKTGNGIDSFLGIPFALPPSDSNRLRAPQPPKTYIGVQDATKYGPGCPGQPLTGNLLTGIPTAVLDQVLALPFFQWALSTAEDCLTINVMRPAGTAPNATLPVLVWIYGGAFEGGYGSEFEGTPIVQRSISTGQPLIHVSMNYRLAGFGFLPGKEVKAAKVGNLGLQDQTFALQWVNKYISLFGGDPSHVTIWGQSAGAVSVGMQMLVNGGRNGGPGGLFQAAVMNSGSPIPVGDITNGQNIYDTVVQRAGCSAAPDTLQCLRTVPYATFKAASDALPFILSYQSLNLSYVPRADGYVLPDAPQKLIAQGQYSKVPMIIGNCADEGTTFSLFLATILTDDQAEQYYHSNYVPSATPAEVSAVAAQYPSDPAQGSPYDTGALNAITPQFKRLASLQGDMFFQAPRRYFLNYASTTQNTWSYLNRRMKDFLIIGSGHGTDLSQYFSAFSGTATQAQDYLINFASTYNPNGKNLNNLLYWPNWNTQNYSMLQFDPSGNTLSLIQDNYRELPIELMTQASEGPAS